MFRIKDKSDKVWGSLCLTDDFKKPQEICFEDGTRRLLKTSDIEFAYGKYKGDLLSECDDKRYLWWVSDSAHKDDDWFTGMCAKLRIDELD